MIRSYLFRALAVAGVVLSCSAMSHAQCPNAQINQAFAANHSTPTAAECDANRYGAGSWTGLPDLTVRVAKARLCSDPWIGQIYWNLYNRNPTAAECSQNYGGRSSYMSYAAAIQASKNAPAPAAAGVPSSYPFFVDARGNLVDNASKSIVAPTGTWDLRNPDGSAVSLVAQGGGNLVAQGGGNLVAQGGGNLVGQTGGNMRSLQSVGGKKVFVVKK